MRFKRPARPPCSRASAHWSGCSSRTAEPTNFDEADVAARNGRYAVAFHELLRRGVALAPGPYEIMFPSLAHDDEVLDSTVAAAAAV